MQTYFKFTSRIFNQSWIALFLLMSIVSSGVLADELCTKGFSSAAAIDGIVAPGVSSGGCSADTVWPQVGPAEFQPGSSNPAGYLRVAHITSTNRLRIGIDVAGDPDVSNFDVVLLFFDANNNDSWDDQDFAIRIAVSPSDVVITSDEACSLATGTVEYFQYNSSESTWDTDAAAAGQITARYAYDYTAPDPEDKIWNLEFDLPINGSGTFQLTTTGSYFAIGGYLFADDGHEQVPQLGSVRAWPVAVVSALTSLLPDISFSFSPLQVTAPAAAALANINLEDVCFDVNFTSQHSWQINGIESDNGNNNVNKTGENRFRIGYYFDGPGDDPQPISNPGTVRMDLYPFRGSAVSWDEAWRTDINISSTPYNFNQLHMSDEVTLNFPGEFGSFDEDDEQICAFVNLVDFQMDDDTSNNELHINHNYFVTSSYEQTVDLSSAGIPNLQVGQTADIWLNIENNNEHPDVRSYMEAQHAVLTSGGRGQSTPLFSCHRLLLLAVAILLLLALLALFFVKNAVLRKLAWALLLLLILILFFCLYRQVTGGDTGDNGGGISTPRWTLSNATELGIKPITGKPGWFKVPITHGETKQLALKFNGQPLPYQPESMRLQAAENGIPGRLDIPVRPGQVLTVVATGEVDLDGEAGPLAATMAGGFTQPATNANIDTQARNRMMKKFFGNSVPYMRKPKRLRATASIAAQPGITAMDLSYPLTSEYYQPHQFTGALSGWFHGNETSSGAFVVGRATSIVVPAGVDTLSLFVNAEWSMYATIIGFYDLFVVSTPAPTVPTRTVPGGDATYRLPLQIPPWLALTSINMFTFFPHVHIEQNVLKGTTLLPLGDAHFTIYGSHVDKFDAGFNLAIMEQ